ncbi:MAG: acylphosphatase [Pelagibacteraceae bacterium]|nr:acylphosphatase [Pelagibacteraceae bacterium]
MKKHLVISGKVQGVGFRYWLQRLAIEKIFVAG